MNAKPQPPPYQDPGSELLKAALVFLAVCTVAVLVVGGFMR